MALSSQTPTTRAQFKEYCLRRLGKGVIEINVSEEQVEDRVDDALQWWWQYHFEGSEKVYFKYQLTEADFTNRYITLPDNIFGAVNMFPVGDTYNNANLFGIRYQIALNDLYTLTSYSLVPYYMARQHLQLIEEVLIGVPPIRYNSYAGKFYIDMDWERVKAGDYLIIECYSIIDPDEYTKAWSDTWLQRYATALIKKQWGNNTKKYGNMQMPGGVVFNGQIIHDEAVAEIKDIESDVIHSYSLPVADLIG